MEETKVKKSSKSSTKKILLIIGLIVGVIILVSVGVAIGAWGYPKAVSLYNKLTGKGDGNEVVIDNGTVKVISEESVIIDVVDKAKNSVVSVALSQVQFSPTEGVIDNSSKIGTGFIVDSNGLIVTNQHVVSDLKQDYKVITADGKSYDVTDITIDDTFDIAVLKVNATGLSALTFGDSDKLKVGQLVIAIGTPLGEYAGSVTTGVISGLNRSVQTVSGSFWSQTAKQYDDVIQTDAAINPGNSGGPLLSSGGQVIGMNFATTSGADNISFALPINRVKERVDQYRTYGKFIKPYMGVEYDMSPLYYSVYNKNITPGALVVRVVSGSPASKGGIKKGDIITYFGGEKVETSLVNYIQKHKVGDEIDVKVYRSGKELTLKVKLEEAN